MRAVTELLASYQHAITDLTLIMGSGGAFEFVVDGETLYSKRETGRHAEPGEILAAFEAFAGPLRRYGE